MRCVIVFADVHDFSKAAVALGDRLPAFVQEYYETVGERIVRAHGSIVKYMGDAVLAVFADKTESTAVQCALAMRADFGELARRWELGRATELEVGVTAGRVTRGTFGHASLRVEDVFGEAVSVACVIGHHRGVAVTEAVQSRVREAYRLVPLEPARLKWREEPEPLWEVAGEVATGRG